MARRSIPRIITWCNAPGVSILDFLAMPPSAPYQSLCQSFTGVPNLHARTIGWCKAPGASIRDCRGMVPRYQVAGQQWNYITMDAPSFSSQVGQKLFGFLLPAGTF